MSYELKVMSYKEKRWKVMSLKFSVIKNEGGRRKAEGGTLSSLLLDLLHDNTGKT